MFRMSRSCLLREESDFAGKRCQARTDSSNPSCRFLSPETENRPPLPDDYIWIKESEIEDYGVPRLIEIMLEKINPAE